VCQLKQKIASTISPSFIHLLYFALANANDERFCLEEYDSTNSISPPEAEGSTASQSLDDLDLDQLAQDLEILSQKILEQGSSPEIIASAEAVANAQIAAVQRDTTRILEYLGDAGDEALEIARFFDVDEAAEALRRSGVATDLDRARIQPWVQLPQEEFLIEDEKLGDLQQKRILRNLERLGICLIRLGAHSATPQLVESVIEMIGTPTEWQNQSRGPIKDIRPQPDITANTGQSQGDLGFHVDGTQMPSQPPVLLFQYATGATLGAHSKFADSAKILRDIPEERRWQLITNLSASDAASFQKGNLHHTGPIFSYSSTDALMCRIRFDDVITVKPEYREEFELLREKFNDPYYPTVFQPRDGDVVLFDNWRVMHARTEVFGSRQRHHRRVWFANLKLEHQVKHLLGIRPIPHSVAVEIQRRAQRA
jgi:alpha-ketoglutarate-dependent taurine dioxygenase